MDLLRLHVPNDGHESETSSLGLQDHDQREGSVNDNQFNAYVGQIITAARSDNPTERVGILLSELQEKSYISGRQLVVEQMRFELNKYDLRPKTKKAAPLPKE
jgi:hypothetical protein